MTINSVLQIVIYFGLLLAITKPLGNFIAAVMNGERTVLSSIFGSLERALYKIGGVDDEQEMTWSQYAAAMLLFSLAGCVLTYVLLRFQGSLPLNPQGFGAKEMTPDLAFDTAVSFTTNTNWQAYTPESTVSYFSNMVSLAIHNWMSAATGLAVAVAVIRGFSRQSAQSIGNFWVDITRGTLYILLPLCLIGALVYIHSGVPQNFLPYQEATTLEGVKQIIAQGPVASQEIIKQLGTNGGGFFNANSAHPYENPTPFSNLFTLLLIFSIPAALTCTFGKMVGNARQGWALFAAMSVMFLTGAFVCTYAEQQGNPNFAKLGVDQRASAEQPGGNMEGKELRFGIPASTLFATITTDASCGAVNSMHDSFTPLGGLVPLFNILTGEVIFGGVGAGLYGMLMFAVLSVFIAGLMVGRTPEYLGKRIQRFEVQMAMLAVLVLAASILGFTALSINLHFDATSAWNRVGTSANYLGPTSGNLNNSGAHGFSEMLYAFASATGNNGSAFAGITVNTPYFNLTLALAMLIGRFLMIIPLLAMSGSLAKKRRVAVSSGTFPTDNSTFVVLLIAVVLIVGSLTFFPALALGPIVEHLQMNSLKLFKDLHMNSKNRPKNSPRSLFEPHIVRRAIKDALVKLNPKTVAKNPVMFVVEVGSAVTTYFWLRDLVVGGSDTLFIGQIAAWLWFTVIFANFAEAMAEGRGKAQADALRRTKTETTAKLLRQGKEAIVSATSLRKGDVVQCVAGDTIPADGDVIEGIASVDESAITGESAPVIRESGGDRSAVTGGTRVLSDRIVIRVTTNPGESFIDRMIALVEGAQRQKTPNEIALSILLSGLTIVFLFATVTLLPYARYSAGTSGSVPSITILVALLVCLIPTTIGGLLSAIGIAGMDRVMQHNVLAMSGRAVEAAGDVNTLLLDKTGTITLGNRQATMFHASPGITEQELADAAQLASLADETPEGRSIVVLAKEKFGIRERDITSLRAEFIKFTAQTRMSGVNLGERAIRKGAADSVAAFVEQQGGQMPPEVRRTVEKIAKNGGTPLVVADAARILGVIQLKDVVKGGMKTRFAQLREMGIKTVMITGDNPLTAAAIAAEAGVDDFLAEATPEMKLSYIRKEQQGGRLVAMTGDGTNDAPALAQADVGVAMNSGTQAAKEAGNMVDLDSNPTKLIEIVEIGKQMLMTRGALTTFSIANDVAKYFAIIPAMFIATYPELAAINFMRLTNPHSAILAAVIFNAIIIIALIPLALRGVSYKPRNAAAILQQNLLVYGLGGIFVPFPGIWAIDRLLVLFHLA